ASDTITWTWSQRACRSRQTAYDLQRRISEQHRPIDLSAQDGDLMTQRQDLGVVCGRRTAQQEEAAQ
ncbi:hypothetical protein, partial [Streptomyces sp. NEAU-S77]|uniref:hypothetical protein n=1 Tax=Streptomyces sp. NEAU-S77 TaxID=3411033 RepID=UPI003BA296AA